MEKEELRGTDVKVEHPNGDIDHGIVSGHSFGIGISIVDPEDTDFEIFCINGPESKYYQHDIDRFKVDGIDYAEAYEEVFNLATKFIKEGTLNGFKIMEPLLSKQALIRISRSESCGDLQCGYK